MSKACGNAVSSITGSCAPSTAPTSPGCCRAIRMGRKTVPRDRSRRRRKLWQRTVLVLACLAAASAAHAEPLKVGILKVGASGPLYIAQERGYFAAEGLDVAFASFGAGQAVAVAVVAGDVDIGVTGLTAGLYNLASGGQIRVVAGLHREAHGFHMLGYFASK